MCVNDNANTNSKNKKNKEIELKSQGIAEIDKEWQREWWSRDWKNS